MTSNGGVTAWNHDIDAAPRGQDVKVDYTRMVNGKPVVSSIEQFNPDWLWIATKCGKVIKTHWKPKDKFGGDRFVGLNKGEMPVAWQRFVVPDHPDRSVTEAAE